MSFATLDTQAARRFHNELGTLAPKVARLQAMALNRIGEKARTLAKREIVAQVSLKESYVLDKLSLSKANAGNPLVILATTRRGYSLVNYDARQLTRASKRARGDALRGIPAGRRQAGVSVKVGRKQARKKMPGAFLIPRRAGQESGANGMGVFIRTGPGKKDIKHLYGPSVSQVFQSAIEKISAEIAPALEQEMQRLLNVELTKGLP